MGFNLYVKSSSSIEHHKLAALTAVINEFGGQEWSVIRPKVEPIVQDISPKNAQQLLDELIANFDELGYGAEDFRLEPVGNSEYLEFTTLFGSPGPELAPSIIGFFGGLSATIDARGYLVGDDDPWEMFIRFIDGEVAEQEYTPFENGEDDAEALKSGVYAWWHEGLPDNIQEGHLHDQS